jgi:hypothetical protein
MDHRQTAARPKQKITANAMRISNSLITIVSAHLTMPVASSLFFSGFSGCRYFDRCHHPN